MNSYVASFLPITHATRKDVSYFMGKAIKKYTILCFDEGQK
jgi:hypothetical protein